MHILLAGKPHQKKMKKIMTVCQGCFRPYQHKRNCPALQEGKLRAEALKIYRKWLEVVDSSKKEAPLREKAIKAFDKWNNIAMLLFYAQENRKRK